LPGGTSAFDNPTLSRVQLAANGQPSVDTPMTFSARYVHERTGMWFALPQGATSELTESSAAIERAHTHPLTVSILAYWSRRHGSNQPAAARAHRPLKCGHAARVAATADGHGSLRTKQGDYVIAYTLPLIVAR
jgi:hypothetical protein